MNEAFAAWTETYFNLRAGVVLNLIYTFLIALIVFVLAPILIRSATKRVHDEEKQVLIANIVRTILRVVGVAAMLRIWLLGKASLAGYLNVDQGVNF